MDIKTRDTGMGVVTEIYPWGASSFSGYISVIKPKYPSQTGDTIRISLNVSNQFPYVPDAAEELAQAILKAVEIARQ